MIKVLWAGCESSVRLPPPPPRRLEFAVKETNRKKKKKKKLVAGLENTLKRKHFTSKRTPLFRWEQTQTQTLKVKHTLKGDLFIVQWFTGMQAAALHRHPCCCAFRMTTIWKQCCPEPEPEPEQMPRKPGSALMLRFWSLVARSGLMGHEFACHTSLTGTITWLKKEPGWNPAPVSHLSRTNNHNQLYKHPSFVNSV